jgi:carbamoyl-phosphate synthase large subunit
VKVSNESPVLLDRFLNDAIEVDVDAVSDGRRVLIGGIMEHIEQAGVHSGDSACSLPPFSLAGEIQDELRRETAVLAGALNVVATGRALAKIAARCMVGRSLDAQGVRGEVVPPYFAVKEAVFPFMKFPGVDTILGPEMKSTGEVMGVGASFGEAFVKSQLAAGVRLPQGGRAFISVRDADKPAAVEVARGLHGLGFALVATRGTAAAIAAARLPVATVNKVTEGRPHVVDMLKNGEIDLIVNTVDERRTAIADSRSIRTTAVQQRITYYTTIDGARAACAGLRHVESLVPGDLQGLHRRLEAA